VWINGARAATGSGGNVLGDPRNALVWLAEGLRRHGRTLRAGELVTTGTTTAPVPVGPGDEVRADFGELGEVEFRFAR
jgi:2-keto-4-pentenoate hydratase